MTEMTNLMTKYLQNIEADEYFDGLDRNPYSIKRNGWGYDEESTLRVESIRSLLWDERLLLITSINNLSGYPFKAK